MIGKYNIKKIIEYRKIDIMKILYYRFILIRIYRTMEIIVYMENIIR